MRPALFAASWFLLAPAAALADEPTAPPTYAPPAPPPTYAPPAALRTYAPPPPASYAPPVSPAEIPPEDPRPNTRGMRIGGIVATALGGGHVLAGGALLFVALTRGGLCGFYGESCSSAKEIGIGAALVITGGVALAVGIPFIVRARKLDRARMARSWHGAPGGAGWEWQF
jgi:hypothetical protein